MSERNYSGEIATMIGAFLKADNWNYDFDKETGNFRFGLNTSSKLKSIEYYVRVNTDAYCVYAISPVGADVSNLEERAAMARVPLPCQLRDALWQLRDGSAGR